MGSARTRGDWFEKRQTPSAQFHSQILLIIFGFSKSTQNEAATQKDHIQEGKRPLEQLRFPEDILLNSISEKPLPARASYLNLQYTPNSLITGRKLNLP